MIVHLLLIKPRADLAAGERAELEEAIPRLASVPGVQKLTWGRDFSGRSKGYQYAAAMEFESRTSLEAYGVHDAHRQIVAIFVRLTEERLVVDYETGTSVSSS